MHNTIGFYGLLASWVFFGGCSARVALLLLRGGR